jgi:Tfp pilus assembly protein PilF
MTALGYLGLGNRERARAAFQEALKLCPNHYGVLSHMKDL